MHPTRQRASLAARCVGAILGRSDSRAHVATERDALPDAIGEPSRAVASQVLSPRGVLGALVVMFALSLFPPRAKALKAIGRLGVVGAHAMVYSQTAGLIALSSSHVGIHVLDAATGGPVVAFMDGTTARAFSPDGKAVAVTGYDDDERWVGLWDVESGTMTTRLQTGHAGAMAFSPDGRALAIASLVYEPDGSIAGGGFRNVAFWDVATRN